jgi:predicted phosphodiesterase
MKHYKEWLRGALAARRCRPQITTVTDTTVTLHSRATETQPACAKTISGLLPDTQYRIGGQKFKTLPRPQGRLLARFATVNDLHFGEQECGRIIGINLGEPLFSLPGETPYPQLMNEAAAEEIARIAPDAVLAKGDLTDCGTSEQFQQFIDTYGRFADRLFIEPGNHDAKDTFTRSGLQTPRMQKVVLPGVILALIDTSIAGKPGGRLSSDVLTWLDDLGRTADRRILVFGHHPVFKPRAALLYGTHYLLNPRDSKKLLAVFAKHRNFCGYFSGHTHRNKVRFFKATRKVPFGEIGSTKEWPGNWAEYRVYEHGIMQIVWRISSPEALAWSERTRTQMLKRVNWLYQRFAMGKLQERCFVFTSGG